MAGIKDDTAVTWGAMSAAAGLLTALRARSGDSQADIIGSQPPEPVATALAVISTALLEALVPDSRGDVFLEILGLAALEQGAKQAGGPE